MLEIQRIKTEKFAKLFIDITNNVQQRKKSKVVSQPHFANFTILVKIYKIYKTI